MIVREYASADEREVITLWKACGLVTPPNDPARDIRLKMEFQPELFLVGLSEARVIATVMAGFDGHRGWLYSLAVSPSFQRQGFGRQIVREAEGRLKVLGCHKVNLQVRSTNTNVIGFYESLGFDVEDRVSLGKRLGQ